MKYFYLLFFIFLICCTNSECETLPKTFSSFSIAQEKIESSDFEIKDVADTSSSSWIRNAKFFSCDGNTGYMIYSTDSKDYIHAGLPIEIWQGFKDAPSKGSYYNHNIKGNYRLQISNE